MEQNIDSQEKYLIRLGAQIRKLRECGSMTHLEISALCNSEKAYLSRIENGRTNATVITLKKIADAIGIPLSELFALEDL